VRGVFEADARCCCSTFTDGTLFVIPNSGADVYGATVKLRQSKAVTGDAYTIMIDTEHALPAGVLQYFYVFIEQKVPSPSNLRLQIWRQNDDYGNDRYQLVWQRLAYLNDSSPQALYTVKRTSCFANVSGLDCSP